MSRIQATFQRLGKNGKKALIPYVTAGDPDPSATVPLMHAMVEAGVDVVELGVPFSDPMADGPVIQRSGERALKHGIGLSDVLKFVVEFRKQDAASPIVLMVLFAVKDALELFQQLVRHSPPLADLDRRRLLFFLLRRLAYYFAAYRAEER